MLKEGLEALRDLLNPVRSAAFDRQVIPEGYQLLPPVYPEEPAHEFADWVSAKRWCERLVPMPFSVFVGLERTVFARVIDGQRGDEVDRRHALVSVPHRWDEESELWLALVKRGDPPALGGARLHMILNQAGDRVAPQVQQALRAFAERRVVRTATDAEQTISDTGAKTLLKNSRGEEIEISLPREFFLNLGLAAPGGTMMIREPLEVFTWVSTEGVELRRLVDAVALRQRYLLEEAEAFFAGWPVFAGEPKFVRG